MHYCGLSKNKSVIGLVIRSRAFGTRSLDLITRPITTHNNNYVILSSGHSEWKEVVRDESITADLDEVGIQIRTRNNEGKVEIEVKDTNGAWHSTIEWSTASTSQFTFGGTCGIHSATELNLSDNQKVFIKLFRLASLKA